MKKLYKSLYYSKRKSLVPLITILLLFENNQLTRMFIIRFYKKGFQKSFGQLNLTGIPRINQVRSSHKLTQVP